MAVNASMDRIGEIGDPVPEFLRPSPAPSASEPQGANRESILQEAQRLTHGPRQADYSHPLDDYTRTAALVNAALRHKLRVNLEPEDLTIIMLLVKVSRQMHKPKRDNMVDAAGYAWCTHEIGAERERRKDTNAHGQMAMGQSLAERIRVEQGKALEGMQRKDLQRDLERQQK